LAKLESAESISINLKDKRLEVKVPRNLKPVIQAKLKRRRFFSNVYLSKSCLLCPVNFHEFTKEELEWIRKNVCSHCNKIVPCIGVRVTEIVSFKNCQMSWYFENILNIPRPYTTALLEGIIAHAFDRVLTDLLNDKAFFEKVKEYYPSRLDMYNFLVETLHKRYDRVCKSIIPEYDAMKPMLEKLLITHKRDVFEKILEDFAYVGLIRIYNDILFGGEYRKLVKRRWEEKRVFGLYRHKGVKLFIVGHIDKLYRLGNDKFVIRDDKTLRVVRVPRRGHGLYDYQLQLGGYSYLLRQLYGIDVETIGVIWLLRYADIAPTQCDEKGFLTVCKTMCEMLGEGKAPLRTYPGGLCSSDYCGYWNSCHGLTEKEGV